MKLGITKISPVSLANWGSHGFLTSLVVTMVISHPSSASPYQYVNIIPEGVERG